MSPVLEKVLQEIEQLTSEELLETIAYATEQLKRRTTDNNEKSYTPEEVIAGYNKIHGTDFTVENILNDPD